MTMYSSSSRSPPSSPTVKSATLSPKGSFKRRSSVILPHSVSIVPSSNPSYDSKLLLNLLPDRFGIERYDFEDSFVGNDKKSSRGPSSSGGAVVISSKPQNDQNNGEHGLMDMIILVKSDSKKVQEVNVNTSQICPCATILLDKDEMKHAVSVLKDQVNSSDETQSPLKGAKLSPFSSVTSMASITVELSDASSTLMLASKSFLSSKSGRSSFVDHLLQTSMSSSPSISQEGGEISDEIEVATDANNGDKNPLETLSTPRKQETMNEKEDIPRPYKFPTLKVDIMDDSGRNISSPFMLNSRVGVPIETNLFKGEALIMMKPPNSSVDDPYYHEKLFSKKKRKMEVQFQGKFKYVPKGMVYCGGEISERMELGLVSKGLCNILLKLVAKLSSGLHYSYGDKANKEWAHICFPAWTFVDRLILTPPGQTPPPLGTSFPESLSLSKSSRGHKGKWNTTDTFSMSFHSMYLDLPTWSVVDLPMMKDMDLKTFWGNSLLRIVLYECGASGGEGKKHLKSDNQYIAALQVEYIRNPQKIEEDDDDDSLPFDKARPAIARSISYNSIDLAGDDTIQQSPKNSPAMSGVPEKMSLDEIVDDEGEDEVVGVSDSERTEFFDAQDSESTSDLLFSDDDGDMVAAPKDNRTSNTGTPLPSTSSNAALLQPNDLCPAWFQMCSNTSNNKYTKVYAFVPPDNSKLIFRTAVQFSRFVDIKAATKIVEGETTASKGTTGMKKCPPRVSSSEKYRRIMGYATSMSLTSSSKRDPRGSSPSQLFQRYKAFCEGRYSFDYKFLRQPLPSPNSSVRKKARGNSNKNTIIIDGYVARALSERHWIEEWAVVTQSYVSFFHPDGKKPNFRISTTAILDVNVLDQQDNQHPNLPSYHFLAMETLGRTFYLMFRKESDCKKWVDVVSNISPSLVGKKLETAAAGEKSPMMMRAFPSSSAATSSMAAAAAAVASSVSSSRSIFDDIITLDDPMGEYLHKSSVWSCKQRRILNCRQFIFDSQNHKQDPIKLVQTALQQALEPSSETEDEEQNLRTFLNTVSQLKSVTLSPLTEAERTTFFLNLYHVMVMHAFLVLGTPTSSFKWVSYFNMIAYQCSGDIFSLTELEHCIIRRTMNYPSQFISKFVLPKSDYDENEGLALSHSDYRLNFAMNCGSISNPKEVPIYRVEYLEEQLDNAVKAYLSQECVKASSSKGRKSVSVTLPRICQWYSSDFGRGRNIDVFRILKKFMVTYQDELSVIPDDKTEPLSGLKSSNISIKFASYDFQCRHLRLWCDEKWTNELLLQFEAEKK